MVGACRNAGQKDAVSIGRDLSLYALARGQAAGAGFGWNHAGCNVRKGFEYEEAGGEDRDEEDNNRQREEQNRNDNPEDIARHCNQRNAEAHGLQATNGAQHQAYKRVSCF